MAILLSGTPAAANQLVVTQLYNPEGTADTLASFLLLQCKLCVVVRGSPFKIYVCLCYQRESWHGNALTSPADWRLSHCILYSRA